ncbi:MAG: undecaprenyl-diphosphate phosphatase, partial [Sphingobacterium sp.]
TASVSDSAVIDQANSMTVPALIFGFLAAFLSGLFACQWMIKLIRNAKLYYFSVYCGLVGILIVAYVFWS